MTREPSSTDSLDSESEELPEPTAEATDRHEITRLLEQWADNRDPESVERLWPLIEHDLARLARKALGGERGDHTLQPTALIHEAYLKLCKRRTLNWANRAQFFATASDLMRKVLVSYARMRKAAKRGKGGEKIPFDDVFERQPGEVDHRSATPLPGWWIDQDPQHVLRFEEALSVLEQVAPPECARVVELKLFFGLTNQEISETLEMSTRQVARVWQAARLHLAEILDSG